MLHTKGGNETHYSVHGTHKKATVTVDKYIQSLPRPDASRDHTPSTAVQVAYFLVFIFEARACIAVTVGGDVVALLHAMFCDLHSSVAFDYARFLAGVWAPIRFYSKH